MTAAQQKRCVSIVSDSLQRRLSARETEQLLVTVGLSQSEASIAFDLIRQGIQSGVNAAVTDGMSAKNYKPGEIALYDAAFDNGYRAFKREVRRVWIKRLFWILVITSLVIFAIVRAVGGESTSHAPPPQSQIPLNMDPTGKHYKH